MKKILFLATTMFVLASCNNHEKVYSFEQVYEHHSIDDSYSPEGIWKYENSDGYIIKDTVGFGPCNSKTTYYDNNGRVIAYVGTASECSPSLIKLFYDDNGRVNMIVDDRTDFYKRYDKLSKNKKFREFDNSVGFDAAVAVEVFEGKPYHKEDVVYSFVYDEDGNLIKVLNPLNDESISAEYGTSLTWSIEECENFWCSDLHGGYHIVKIKSRHNHPDGKVSFANFRDYKILSKDTYDGNKMIGKELYELMWNDEENEYVLILSTFDISDSEIAETSGNDYSKSVHRFNGNDVVQYERISQFNTVLRRINFKRVNNGFKYQVYDYDYSEKKLKIGEAGITTDEVLSLYNYCSNCYDEIYLYKNDLIESIETWDSLYWEPWMSEYL